MHHVDRASAHRRRRRRHGHPYMTVDASGPRLLAAPRRARPADLLPPVPVLPSHTATWRDVAMTDSTHLRVEHAPTLPTGWAGDWTLTTTRGGNERTVAASGLTWDLVSGADPMLVPTWHPNSKARAGVRFVGATGRHHQFQSKFERDLLLVLEFDGLHDLTSQPFEMEWLGPDGWRQHTPDFAVLTDEGPALFNVRPAVLLNDKHRVNTAALAAVADAAGWACYTVVGYRSPALQILQACSAGRFAPDPAGIAAEVRTALTHGPMAFHRAAASTSCDPFARAMLRFMVWHRTVTLDLNHNVNDDTVVGLPGHP